MSEDLESRLHAALTPVAPRPEFTQNLMARVNAGKRTDASTDGRRRSPKVAAWWLIAGTAASLLAAVGVQHHLQLKRQMQSGLEARREVIEALHITSEKLNLAYEVIKRQSSAPADDRSGV